MTRLMSKQKVRLFELLEENYHILSGPNRGNGEKTVVWEEIKEVLNEMGPPKTTEKWRRVWTDIRKTLRKKVSLRQTYEMNGARVPDEFTFSESDLWVIRICGMDAIEKPNKIVKQEVIDVDESDSAASLRLSEVKPTRSSQRVSNRKNSRKPAPPVDELIDDRSLLCPVIVFSDDKATQWSESPPSSSSPPKKKVRNSNNVFVNTEKDPVPVVVAEEDNNKNQLKQLICLQKRQLAVTRQIHERQKCHNADQRQFNARVTNLLEEILQQLKTTK